MKDDLCYEISEIFYLTFPKAKEILSNIISKICTQEEVTEEAAVESIFLLYENDYDNFLTFMENMVKNES